MNVLTYFNAMAPYIKGKSIYQLFPESFVENLPFARYQPFHCLGCACQMTPDMIMPPGKVTPRAICQNCWDQFTARFTGDCLVCNEPMEDAQVLNQQAAPKDLHHRIHGGKCRDYFSLVSARALGYETGILEENDFLINREGHKPVELIPKVKQPEQIPLKRVTPALGHNPQQSVKDMLEQARQNRTFEGKPVKEVLMQRNDKGIYE